MFRLPPWSSLAAIAIAVSGIVATIIIESVGDDRLREFGSVPDFELIERNGNPVTLSDLEGQIWVANLIFTNCGGMCPMMTNQMRSLQETLPESVRLVSFTVDPNRDTPEVLSTYADRHGAEGDRWIFLTGERDQIYRLSKEGFHLAVDDTIGTEIEPITHSTRFVLVDQIGTIRSYYDGTSRDSVARLVQDVRDLGAEAN